jgi:hypothetical protein
MSNWPTPEELEAQQSPFDPNGSYPYQYRIVILEKDDNGVFHEQLRTYTITEQLDEESLSIPSEYEVEIGRTYREAAAGEKATIFVMNQEVEEPIGLIPVEG